MMERTEKRTYERPRTRAIELQHCETLLQASGGRGTLGGFRNSGRDAWSGGSGSGGSSMGGWTDSGDDPWK